MGFEQADKFRAKWEGGLSDNKADPGGITNYGISLRFLRAQGHDVDGDGDIDADDIKALTPADAALLLKQEFWTCQDLNSFPPLTAIVHYDASVNCGRGRAVRLLQAACNVFDGDKIKEDGRLGPKTRARVAGLVDETLALRCIQERQAFYARLIAAKPDLAAFSDGWTNRANDLTKYVQEIAHVPASEELAATPSESNARGVPVNQDGASEGPSPRMVPEVGKVLPLFLARLVPVLKTLSTSKTMAGVVGLVAMQLTGHAPWDIRLWIGGQIYDIPNLQPYVATALAALATWGRITVKPAKR